MATAAKVTSRRAQARLFWRRIHLWLALFIGLPLALLGLSGAVLVLKNALFKVDFGAETFAVTPQDSPYAMPGAWIVNAQKAYPQIERVVSIAGPRQSPIETDAALLTVMLKDGGYGFVTIDPYTAKVHGFFRYGDGLVFKALDFHRSFLLPEAWETLGESATAIIAIFLFLSAGSGLYLWWPRNGGWKRALVVQAGSQRLRSLHNVSAVYLLIPLMVIAATGVVLAKPEWLGVGRGGQMRGAMASPAAKHCAKPADLDDAAAAALATSPGSKLAAIRMPARNGDGYSIRLLAARNADEASASVAVDRCGMVGRIRRDSRGRDGGVIQTLHGSLMAGGVGQTLVLFAGLALPLLYVTGIWMWLRRHRPAG